MKNPIFTEIKKTAHRLGSCDPLWLKAEEDPVFSSVEPGGNGPDILLLHGLLGALSNWDSLLPELTSFANPIALHFPILTGHRSEVRVKALSVFTEFFIRQRQMQPVTLCGNSLGGHVALRLALASPEMVDCLVLSGSSGLYEHSVDSLPIRPDKNYVREHMGRVFAQQRFVTPEAVDEIHAILSDRKYVLNLIHAARSAKKDNMQRELKNLRMPTLLLWGEDDQVTTMEVAEIFHKNIPNSKLVTMKNCGHAPMIEHPEWFAEEMKKFLMEHSQAYGKSGAK